MSSSVIGFCSSVSEPLEDGECSSLRESSEERGGRTGVSSGVLNESVMGSTVELSPSRWQGLTCALFGFSQARPGQEDAREA